MKIYELLIVRSNDNPIKNHVKVDENTLEVSTLTKMVGLRFKESLVEDFHKWSFAEMMWWERDVRHRQRDKELEWN